MIKKDKGLSYSRGYTMVELMSVVVLISILSASAASYFSGTGVIAERSFRKEMMVAAKYAQQQAMHDTGLDGSGNRLRCYRFAIVTSGGVVQFGPQRDSGSGYAYFGHDYPITLTNSITTAPATGYIYFDSLGASVTSCVDSTPRTQSVTLIGDTAVSFTAETTGYVHEI